MRFIQLYLPILATAITAGCVEPYYDDPPVTPAAPVMPAAPVPIEVPAGTPLVIVITNGQPTTVVPEAPSGIAHRWHGSWSTPTGYRCSFNLVLDSDARGWLDGYFEWKLLAAPRGSSQVARIGQTGKEYVRGTFDPAAHRLDLEGYEVDNPRLLVTDDYHLVLDPSGTRFAGRSRGDGGNWVDVLDGHVVAEPN